MKNKQDSLELYVHIPFCVRKCSYCDFLSFPADAQAQEQYVQALLEEIGATEEGTGRGVSSVFIGGGTPSVLAADCIERILAALGKKFRILSGAEITIEANPGTLDGEKLRAYRKSGINRLSMGLQSAREEELKILGRIHTYEEFRKNYWEARESGFDNINVDLMFAVPGQSRRDWEYNLRTVAALEPEHISAYSLIIEEGTPFAQMELALPDEDTEYEMYEDTARILEAFGYDQYEISNYARKGYACRHNIGYWKRADYLGIGLGAASLMGNRRFSNTRSMKEYLLQSACPARLRRMESPLGQEDEMAEFLFLGLRMREGVGRQEFQNAFGCPLETVYGPVLEKYFRLGLLGEKDGRVFLTRKGIHVSNTVMADFL